MRIDHYAYQRAVRVAGVGLATQAGVGLTLFIISRVFPDTALMLGSLSILVGVFIWLGLVVLFQQHKLERLEALEEDELAATRDRDDLGSERAPDEVRVAARRLETMHAVLMPVVSLAIAATFGILAWFFLRLLSWIRRPDGDREFLYTAEIGWAIALCVAFSVLAFILSRFVAGMAKQEVWQNLRGGAATMVGTSLITLAIVVGLGFRFFGNQEVIWWVAHAIPILLIVLAAEIVLNFVLNLYRPRIPGEVPRPAFDSRLLSLLAAPDNIVRSINEAVNYQFGFDITSSWGYQLLLRRGLWLLSVGLAVVVALNCIVIVEPTEQAVRLSRGKISDDRVHGSGIMWKLPWPLQTAERFPVTEVRRLHLTNKRIVPADVVLWTDDLGQSFDAPLDPFMVVASRLRGEEAATVARATSAALRDADLLDTPGLRAADTTSLLDAEIVLQYRIREDGGLLDYLRFVPDTVRRRTQWRQVMTSRELAVRGIALRAITQHLSRLTVDDVMARNRPQLALRLRDAVQADFDRHRVGLEVVAIDLPLLRPAGEAAASFEELSVSEQQRVQLVAAARQEVERGFADLVGDRRYVDALIADIDIWQDLQDRMIDEVDPVLRDEIEHDLREQQFRLQRRMVEGGGEIGLRLMEAERDRWVRVMESRAQAQRLAGQIAPYQAAPWLYRQREVMEVYASRLPRMRKFILGIDPSRVDIHVDLKEINPLFEISDALAEDKGPLD